MPYNIILLHKTLPAIWVIKNHVRVLLRVKWLTDNPCIRRWFFFSMLIFQLLYLTPRYHRFSIEKHTLKKSLRISSLLQRWKFDVDYRSNLPAKDKTDWISNMLSTDWAYKHFILRSFNIILYLLDKLYFPVSEFYALFKSCRLTLNPISYCKKKRHYANGVSPNDIAHIWAHKYIGAMLARVTELNRHLSFVAALVIESVCQ